MPWVAGDVEERLLPVAGGLDDVLSAAATSVRVIRAVAIAIASSILAMTSSDSASAT